MKRCFIFLLIIISSCKSEIDCIEGNCNTGTGKFIYSDGVVYEGEFKDGKRHGKGKIYSPKGTYYEGDWRNHQPNGHGYKYWGQDFPNRTGDSYNGSWKDGKMHGMGWYTFANGKIEAGWWIDNKMEPNDSIPNDVKVEKQTTNIHRQRGQ